MNLQAIAFLAGNFLFLASSGVNARELSTEQKLQGAFERANHVRAIETDFSHRHPHKGVLAGPFLRSLGDEHMACRLQYRKKFDAGAGDDLGKFSATLEPGIECSTGSFSKPECTEFRVSLEIQWKDPRKPLSSLKNDVERAPIRHAYFICETTSRLPADTTSIEKAIQKGDAVPIK